VKVCAFVSCIIQRETKAFELRAKHLINPRKFALAELLPAQSARGQQSHFRVTSSPEHRKANTLCSAFFVVIKVSGNEQVVCSLSAMV